MEGRHNSPLQTNQLASAVDTIPGLGRVALVVDYNVLGSSGGIDDHAIDQLEGHNQLWTRFVSGAAVSSCSSGDDTLPPVTQKRPLASEAGLVLRGGGSPS